MAGETATAKDRKPVMPAPIMADKGKGRQSKTPALPTKAAHIPDRAEGVMATPKVPHPDGMAKMAKMQTESRAPVMAPSHSMSAGKNVNKGA